MAPASEVLNKYCVTCHNSRLKTAGLALDSLDLARAGERADAWEKVATKLRTREMPPPGRPRPDATTYTAATDAVEPRSTPPRRCIRIRAGWPFTA